MTGGALGVGGGAITEAGLGPGHPPNVFLGQGLALQFIVFNVLR